MQIPDLSVIPPIERIPSWMDVFPNAFTCALTITVLSAVVLYSIGYGALCLADKILENSNG